MRRRYGAAVPRARGWSQVTERADADPGRPGQVRDVATGSVRYGVRAYRLTYRTVDPQGAPTTATGLLTLPKGGGHRLDLVSDTHDAAGAAEGRGGGGGAGGRGAQGRGGGEGRVTETRGRSPPTAGGPGPRRTRRARARYRSMVTPNETRAMIRTGRGGH